jgi:hypothetical protein
MTTKYKHGRVGTKSQFYQFISRGSTLGVNINPWGEPFTLGPIFRTFFSEENSAEIPPPPKKKKMLGKIGIFCKKSFEKFQKIVFLRNTEEKIYKKSALG